jgi:RNA 3'-terminal phosphate cyclase (ATP)
MLILDGSFGEGGGQILRSSLALSLVTGAPFRIEKIRAGRKNPGLLRQHLTAVQAAAMVGAAEVTGAFVGSKELTFKPSQIKGGDYAFAIGTAGSAMLVLQTILLPLLIADEASTLSLEGGTHNPFAPPFDFLTMTFLPILNRMGAKVSARLERYGFYPAGGGKAHFAIEPCATLKPIELLERGELVRRSAKAIVANLPRHIAERELDVIRRRMDFDQEQLEIIETTNSNGPGNALLIEIASRYVTEVFTAFGEKGVSAERVAEQVIKEAREYLYREAAVGEHLADQLLLPMALAGGGVFTTIKPSLHTTTNIEVIKRFLDVQITVTPLEGKVWRIEIKQ